MWCWHRGSAELTPLLDEVASGGARYNEGRSQWLAWLVALATVVFAFGSLWVGAAALYAIAADDVSLQGLVVFSHEGTVFIPFDGTTLAISIAAWSGLLALLCVAAHVHFKRLDEDSITGWTISASTLRLNVMLCVIIVVVDIVLVTQPSKHWASTVSNHHTLLRHA
jgi:hypothetical protein